MGLIRITSNENVLSFKAFIFTQLLAPWAGNYFGSLVYPLVLILIWLGIMIPLYRKKIYIKI